MVTGPDTIPLLEEHRELLAQYGAGYDVLQAEASSIKSAVDILGVLNSEPGGAELTSAVASAATSEDIPAVHAVEYLPYIQKAVEPFRPKQLDAEVADNQRWTMDWRAVRDAINARVEQDPRVSEQLTKWFLENGSSFIETSYAPETSKYPLYEIPGGANDQPQFRPFLALASMASPEFREANGLVTLEAHSLRGETARAEAWLSDDELAAKLREHVVARIAAGEIQPRVVVFGSADMGRVLKKNELEIVSRKYLSGSTIPILYEDRGITEADGMLAGSVKVFGGDPESVVVHPAVEDGQTAKLVTYDSAIGRVAFLATVGKEANIVAQVTKSHELLPELFEGIDGLYGTTTGIYSWNHRTQLRAAAARLSINVPTDMFGLSAHAAGIGRDLGQVVGELTNYLGAVHDIAVQSLASAEKYTQSHLYFMGGSLAVEAAVDSE